MEAHLSILPSDKSPQKEPRLDPKGKHWGEQALSVVLELLSCF